MVKKQKINPKNGLQTARNYFVLHAQCLSSSSFCILLSNWKGSHNYTNRTRVGTIVLRPKLVRNARTKHLLRTRSQNFRKQQLLQKSATTYTLAKNEYAMVGIPWVYHGIPYTHASKWSCQMLLNSSADGQYKINLLCYVVI